MFKVDARSVTLSERWWSLPALSHRLERLQTVVDRLSLWYRLRLRCICTAIIRRRRGSFASDRSVGVRRNWSCPRTSQELPVELARCSDATYNNLRYSQNVRSTYFDVKLIACKLCTNAAFYYSATLSDNRSTPTLSQRQS